jgi:type III pantothenate kinase
MEALSSGTSLPPRVSLDAPKKVISTNTIECMQSGAIFGSASMIDGMIERMEAELGKKCAVVATGGLAGVVAPYCRRDILLEPDLLLKGLSILWEKNRRAPRT